MSRSRLYPALSSASIAAVCAAVAFATPSIAPASQGTLVVLNKSDATATLIDLDSGSTVATLPTGDGPHEGAVSPDGRLVLVTNYGGRDAPGSTLTVIDVPAAKVAKTIDLGEYRRPHGVVWLRDGRRALVTAEENQSLLVVEVESGRVVKTIATGQDVSHMVAVTPDEMRAFVANIGSGSVTVLDLDAGQHVKDVKTGAGAEGIEITPSGKEVWVTNRAADTISILDAATLEVVRELNVKAGLEPDAKPFPIRARATPDGKHVLVSTPGAGEVAVFDAATRELLRRIPMKLKAESVDGRLFGGQFGASSVPIGILIPSGGKRAYVANANADAVAIIDLETWEVVGSLKAGREPDGMAWSPLSSRVGA